MFPITTDPAVWFGSGWIWSGLVSCAVFGTAPPCGGQEKNGAAWPRLKKKLVVLMPRGWGASAAVWLDWTASLAAPESCACVQAARVVRAAAARAAAASVLVPGNLMIWPFR